MPTIAGEARKAAKKRVLAKTLEGLLTEDSKTERVRVTMRLYYLALLLGAAAGDHYHTLGLRRRASQKQIKKAYRDLAKQHHPDKGGDPEKFAAVAAAYEVLGDEVKRRRYDSERLGAQHGFGGGGFHADPPGFHSYRPQQRFVFVRRNGRMYRVPLDDYDNFERSYQAQGLDSSVSLQMVALGLLAAFFYFSSAVAADVNGTGVPQRRRGGYEAARGSLQHHGEAWLCLQFFDSETKKVRHVHYMNPPPILHPPNHSPNTTPWVHQVGNESEVKTRRTSSSSTDAPSAPPGEQTASLSAMTSESTEVVPSCARSLSL